MQSNKISFSTNENFTKEILNNRQTALVEFSTKWCGTSQIVAPILEEMAVQYKGKVTFFKIDIEECGDVAKQFGIRNIPTILFFKNGEVVDFIYGVASREILIEKLDALIE